MSTIIQVKKIIDALHAEILELEHDETIPLDKATLILIDAEQVADVMRNYIFNRRRPGDQICPGRGKRKWKK